MFDLSEITLSADADIAGKSYPKGAVVKATQQAVQAGYKRAAKQKVRKLIEAKSGDLQSQLGTTSDAAALALYGVATLIGILNEHGSASVKTAIGEAADGQLVVLSDRFITNIENGTLVLPALAKGIDKVASEIETRSTGVAQVLANPEG